MQTVEHIKGATFSYSGLVKLPAGTWQASCDLARGGSKVSDLTVTLTPLVQPGSNGETHSILIECAASVTSGWPVSVLDGDIKFSASNGVVVYSDQFSVTVRSAITDA